MPIEKRKPFEKKKEYRVAENERKTFTVLEKDLLIIKNPEKIAADIIIPGVQSCICLIVWHKDLCAVIHANGKGNEIAAYNYLANQFEQKGINRQEVKVFMLGGYYQTAYSNFAKEMLFWASGLNSNAIAHPMLHVLKQRGFSILPENIKQHQSFAEGNFLIVFRSESVESLNNIFVEVTDEASKKDTDCMGEEFKRRGETVKHASQRITSSASSYQIHQITEKDLVSNYIADAPVDNCGDVMTKWFPRP